jgi:hypothetical protein
MRWRVTKSHLITVFSYHNRKTLRFNFDLIVANAFLNSYKETPPSPAKNNRGTQW